MQRMVGRRGFLTGSLAAGAAAGCGRDTRIERDPTPQGEEAGKAAPSGRSMPTGKLGKLTVSRLIAGGNIIHGGYPHARDLAYVSKLAQAYLTEQKQFDTLALYEKWGINAIMTGGLGLIKKYRRERGGRIQTIAQVQPPQGRWAEPKWDDLKAAIDRAIDEGADAVYVQGSYADRLVESGKKQNIELLGKAMDHIRARGYPAGLGSHALEVPQECDKLGISPDYYVKTFHHDKYWSATPKERRKRFCVDGPFHLDHNEFHDNIFCIDPEETAEYMKSKTQPWIAFKVLAAGAIPPKSGFHYAFENGADFIAVGMFDFQVVQDVSIAEEVIESIKDRARPWRA